MKRGEVQEVWPTWCCMSALVWSTHPTNLRLWKSDVRSMKNRRIRIPLTIRCSSYQLPLCSLFSTCRCRFFTLVNWTGLWCLLRLVAGGSEPSPAERFLSPSCLCSSLLLVPMSMLPEELVRGTVWEPRDLGARKASSFCSRESVLTIWWAYTLSPNNRARKETKL